MLGLGLELERMYRNHPGIWKDIDHPQLENFPIDKLEHSVFQLCNRSYTWMIVHICTYDIWVVVSNMCFCSPHLGKISNLTFFFQMGWNHQLASSHHTIWIHKADEHSKHLSWLVLVGTCRDQYSSPMEHLGYIISLRHPHQLDINSCRFWVIHAVVLSMMQNFEHVVWKQVSSKTLVV